MSEEVLHSFRFALMHHRMISKNHFRHHVLPDTYWADSLSAVDWSRFRAVKGDPA